MPRIIGYDVNDKPIYDTDIAPSTSAATKNAAPVNTNPQSDGPYFNVGPGPVERMINEHIHPVMDPIGTALGTAFGATAATPGDVLTGGVPLASVAGGAAGGIYGNILMHKLLNKIPGLFGEQNKEGEDPELVRNAIINQVFESVGAPLVGKAADSKPVRDLVNGLLDNPSKRALLKLNPQQLNAIRGPGSSISDLEAVKATPELSRSVGETTGSKPLQFLENTEGKQALVDLRQNQRIQQQVILDKLRGTDLSPESIGTMGQAALGNAYATSKAAYTDLYDQFDNQVVKPAISNINVVVGHEPDIPSSITDPATGQPGPPTPGKPIIKQDQVALPIYLNNTASYAQGEDSQAINKLLSPEDFENLPDGLKRSYNLVKGLLRDAVTPTEIQLSDGSIQSIPFKAYDAIKETRTKLSDLLNTATGLNRQVFSSLRDSLDQDIRDTLNARDPSGAANVLRDKMNAAFQVHSDIIDPVMDRVYKNDPSLKQYEDPSAMFQAADTSAKVARQLRAAFKPIDLPVLKTGMMSQAIDNAYEPATGLTNIDQILNKVTDPASPYLSVFTKSEIDNTETLLRGMRTQNPGQMQTGKAISFIGTHFALTLAGAAAGAMAGRNEVEKVAGALTGAAVVMIAPSQFVNRVLLNPTYARMVAQLPKMAADSPSAQLIVKSLMQGAFRGAQVTVQTPDGQQQQAQVGRDGRLIMGEN